jgi:aminoglycoside 6'-N-acetyltransferase I
VRIEPVTAPYLAAWATMRSALWPEEDSGHLAAEAAEWIATGAPDQLNIVAIGGEGAVVAFAEAALRHDYVNGCDGSPVAFLEGIYVALDHRRRGVARALVDAVAVWARSKGIEELASDALIDNQASHAFHARLGFVETERVVYFRKELAA